MNLKRGHEETLYLDWILLAAGIFLYIQGIFLEGIALAIAGIGLHFLMGGFATGF